MTAQPFRSYAPDPREPALQELPPLRIADQSITLQLCTRRADDGAWRGRLRFIDSALREHETAEIFCGSSEAELWQSVQGLREHHLRALYLSLVQRAMSDGDRLSRLRHDLSNPLSALLAETQLLLLNESQIDPETLTGLREIEALAIRMRSMLRDI